MLCWVKDVIATVAAGDQHWVGARWKLPGVVCTIAGYRKSEGLVTAGPRRGEETGTHPLASLWRLAASQTGCSWLVCGLSQTGRGVLEPCGRPDKAPTAASWAALILGFWVALLLHPWVVGGEDGRGDGCSGLGKAGHLISIRFRWVRYHLHLQWPLQQSVLARACMICTWAVCCREAGRCCPWRSQ